jgi:predicted aconitase with swiveling domain
MAEGEAMVTTEPFGFTHGIDPATGKVGDKRHEWIGQTAKGKVLVFPHGKASTTGGLLILELVRRGNNPSAIINVETDPVIGAGFIMAKIFYNKEIPVVDRLDKKQIQTIDTGDLVRVDANKGIVEVIKPEL